MEFWLMYLPIVIYFLVIALLIVLIILGLKGINFLNKVDKIIDNINEKIESINPIFHMLDFATDKIANLSDSIVEYFAGFLGRILNKKDKRKESKHE